MSPRSVRQNSPLVPLPKLPVISKPPSTQQTKLLSTSPPTLVHGDSPTSLERTPLRQPLHRKPHQTSPVLSTQLTMLLVLREQPLKHTSTLTRHIKLVSEDSMPPPAPTVLPPLKPPDSSDSRPPLLKQSLTPRTNMPRSSSGENGSTVSSEVSQPPTPTTPKPIGGR